MLFYRGPSDSFSSDGLRLKPCIPGGQLRELLEQSIDEEPEPGTKGRK